MVAFHKNQLLTTIAGESVFRNKIPEPCWIPEEPHQEVWNRTIGAGCGLSVTISVTPANNWPYWRAGRPAFMRLAYTQWVI